MKTRLPKQGSAKAHLILLLLSIAMLTAVCRLQGFAQSRESAASVCKVGVQAPAYGYFKWAPNSRVKVYLRTQDFKTAEIFPVLAPLRSWNAVSALTGSGVILEYSGETEAEQFCDNCLTIMRGPLSAEAKRKAFANLRVYHNADNDQIMIHGALVIEPTLTNLAELTDLVAHELGHSFGLFDCLTCKSKSTVMNQFKGLNAPNELPAPTPCDIAQVNAAYRELLTFTTRSTTKPLPTEEGEEPVEDDTPIVIGKPND